MGIASSAATSWSWLPSAQACTSTRPCIKRCSDNLEHSRHHHHRVRILLRLIEGCLRPGRIVRRDVAEVEETRETAADERGGPLPDEIARRYGVDEGPHLLNAK